MILHMSCSSYLIVLFIWKIQGGHFLWILRSSSYLPPRPPPPPPPKLLLPLQEQSGHIKQWALEYSPCRTPLASATFYATWSNVWILLDICASIENKGADRKCKNDRTVLLPISIKNISVKCWIIVVFGMNTENFHFMKKRDICG